MDNGSRKRRWWNTTQGKVGEDRIEGGGIRPVLHSIVSDAPLNSCHRRFQKTIFWTSHS